MPDEIRVGRSPQQPVQQHSSMRSDMPMQQEMEATPARSNKMPWIVLGLIVIVLIVLVVLFRNKLFMSGSGSASLASDASQASGYQAVFLTNGQVYFGKMSNDNGDYPILTDIYYLQVVQPPLQGQQQPGQAAPQQQISLVKLGNELHGPVDEMHISKAQILFYEDLKTSGQVVQAIKAYKANPTGTAAPVTSPTPTQ